MALHQATEAVASLRPLSTQATDAFDRHELMQVRTLVAMAMAIEKDAGYIWAQKRTAVRNSITMAQKEDADSQTVAIVLSLVETIPRSRVQTAWRSLRSKGKRRKLAVHCSSKHQLTRRSTRTRRAF